MAGRGPAIGPLVVCALGVPEEDIEVLSDIGAKDSKSMSKKKEWNWQMKYILKPRKEDGK